MRSARSWLRCSFNAAAAVTMLSLPISGAAQSGADMAAAIKNVLVQCGEFKTAGFDFRNHRDTEGVVWPAGRQQDVYQYTDVRNSGGVLNATEWVGHLRDFQPYGSRTRAIGYIETLSARTADIAPNPAVVELTAEGASRGLYGVRLACRSGNCVTIGRQPLFPADVSNVMTPLRDWRPSGVQEQRTSSAWNFEVCSGFGKTSQQNAEELQRALQQIIR